MYYLYHIPGKKIGVTRNLNKRVTLTQGYKPEEYEVLDQSDDINYISDKEIELQQSYGYKVDTKKYNELFKLNKLKMKINVTEQTTTFPVPVSKLKGRLIDDLGMSWKTEFGRVTLNNEIARWIENNAQISRYNSERSYVYNKALWEACEKINNKTHTPDVDTLIMMSSNKATDTSKMFDLIRKWALDRGLYQQGDSHTQYVKLQEEAGELAKALLKKDKPEIVDAIGDMVVVLTNLAHLEGVDIETCIASAYNVINKRTGKIYVVAFVKDE